MNVPRKFPLVLLEKVVRS